MRNNEHELQAKPIRHARAPRPRNTQDLHCTAPFVQPRCTLTRGSTNTNSTEASEAVSRDACQRDCVAFVAGCAGASSMPASNPSAVSALFFALLMRITVALLSVNSSVSDAICSREVASSRRAFFSSSRREPLSVSSRDISACVEQDTV